MPRTVDHIVACHQAASALQKAGKPIWEKSINIKAILAEDQANESPEHIAAISVRIAALIRSKVPTHFFDLGDENYDSDFVDCVESMEQCTVNELAADKSVGVDAVDLFNEWLEGIYDWADENRIWLGK